MKHEEITRDIIGAAMTVLNELKPGLDERLYENALVLELTARGHTTQQHREFPVHYRGQFIGKLVPDLIGYPNITDLEVALLLNFKESTLTWKRVVRERKELTADCTDDADEKQKRNP